MLGKFKGEKVLKFLLSKAMTCIYCLLILTAVITFASGWYQEHLSIRYPLNIAAGISILLMLLSANRLLFRNTLWSFDFIVKTCYAIRLIFCYQLLRDRGDGSNLIGHINYMLLVTLWSLMDGLRWSRRVRLSISVLLTVLHTVYSVRDMLYMDPELVPFFGFEIDIAALIIGSSQGITVFAWAQLYRMVIGPRLSTMIVRRVRLHWMTSITSDGS